VSRPGRRLFGTDGVRGTVGDFLNSELALSLGRAACLAVDSRSPSVLVIRDTRESGPMLESAFAAGVAEAGGEAVLAGVLPTPAAPILASAYSCDLAAVISASHNPHRDNGIKLFGPNGRKLNDATEAEIERLVSEGRPLEGSRSGRIETLNAAEADYLRTLLSHYEIDLSGLRIALDCANGATYRVGPEAFRRLGADVSAFFVEPDGRNINLECGSTHTEVLADLVREGEFDLGFSFDGDGDRVQAVDRNGRVHDGDEIIAIMASGMVRSGRRPAGLAMTVMTNFGFHRAMDDLDVEVSVTSVGDRNVLERLDELGWSLGGEQSGHIIDLEYAPTGDGVAAALGLLRALDGRDLAESAAMERLPQEMINVVVEDREAFAASTGIASAIERAGQSLEGRGRILVRPSGTEPLIRVMVEAPTTEEALSVCSDLAARVESELSGPTDPADI
jgi:phosphoglucosamine mutase